MRRKQMKRRLCVLLTLSLLCSCLAAGCGSTESSDEIVLRVANWEEYIDEGDWDEEERIDLENGASILGEHSMVDDFEEWYYETYGKRVRVFLLEFLRPEKKFGSLEELKAAIQTNGEQAKEVAAQVPPPYFPSRRQGRCAGESPA